MSIYAICIANILVFLKTVVQEAMKHKTLLILLTLLLTFSSHAGPARQGIIPLIQPDGTIFDAIIRGDEFLRWTTTREGNAIVQEEDGWWCYATFDNEGNRSSSGWRVGETAPAAIMSESKFIPLERLSAAASRKRRAHSYFMEYQPLTKNGVLSQKHVIVILAQFNDVRFEYSRQDFIDMLTKDGYSRNGSIGSAKEYFDGQFKGKTEFSFEVSDIITLPGKRADYGSNLPNGEDKDPTRMIIEACQATTKRSTSHCTTMTMTVRSTMYSYSSPAATNQKELAKSAYGRIHGMYMTERNRLSCWMAGSLTDMPALQN